MFWGICWGTLGGFLFVRFFFLHMAMSQNLRYLLSRDYHLFKRLFKGRGTGF